MSKPVHIPRSIRWKSPVPKLPSVSGRKAIRSLNRMGFIIVRQRGSHVYMQREAATVTVPLNDPVKKKIIKRLISNTNLSGN